MRVLCGCVVLEIISKCVGQGKKRKIEKESENEKGIFARGRERERKTIEKLLKCKI